MANLEYRSPPKQGSVSPLQMAKSEAEGGWADRQTDGGGTTRNTRRYITVGLLSEIEKLETRTTALTNNSYAVVVSTVKNRSSSVCDIPSVLHARQKLSGFNIACSRQVDGDHWLPFILGCLRLSNAFGQHGNHDCYVLCSQMPGPFACQGWIWKFLRLDLRPPTWLMGFLCCQAHLAVLRLLQTRFRPGLHR